jgi:hypothetical protein
MIQDKEFERLFRQEFKEILPNTIWKNTDGSYQVFGHYCIVPEHPGYRVFCAATEIGLFYSTKTAMSWCVADKYKNYNLARELYNTDSKLNSLINDINVRIYLGDHSKTPDFQEKVGTKLETKIIRKKQLENQLAKYISWAKYTQQRGFNNETVRTNQGRSNKPSR